MILSVNGPGTVPLGAIIPVGNVGAWALPASGEIKDGFALCNGAAFPAGSHPSFAGNRPNLTDDRFLNGTSSVGGLGGATSKTTTGIAASFDKNVMNTNQNTHTHMHPLGGSSSGMDYTYSATSINGQSYASTFGTRSATVVGASRVFPSSTGWGSVSVVGFSTVSPETISWTSTVVNTTVIQGTISDIRPKYFDVVYLMRVI